MGENFDLVHFLDDGWDGCEPEVVYQDRHSPSMAWRVVNAKGWRWSDDGESGPDFTDAEVQGWDWRNSRWFLMDVPWEVVHELMQLDQELQEVRNGK